MHIECEHIEVWKGQKIYRDVEELLIAYDFALFHTKTVWPQSDSIWVQKEFHTSELIDKMTEPCATRWVVPAEPPANFVAIESNIAS